MIPFLNRTTFWHTILLTVSQTTTLREISWSFQQSEALVILDGFFRIYLKVESGATLTTAALRIGTNKTTPVATIVDGGSAFDSQISNQIIRWDFDNITGPYQFSEVVHFSFMRAPLVLFRGETLEGRGGATVAAGNASLVLTPYFRVIPLYSPSEIKQFMDAI